MAWNGCQAFLLWSTLTWDVLISARLQPTGSRYFTFSFGVALAQLSTFQPVPFSSISQFYFSFPSWSLKGLTPPFLTGYLISVALCTLISTPTTSKVDFQMHSRTSLLSSYLICPRIRTLKESFQEHWEICAICGHWFSVNKLSGEINEFLDGLSACSYSTLENMDFGYNKLTGNLQDSLGHLKNLRYLQLLSNSFCGSIPESIGSLSSLQVLYLSQNQMGGIIPDSIGQLSSLVMLELNENSWEGVITEAHFSNLSSLKQLSITKSSPNVFLVFNISSDWAPPLDRKSVV